MRLQQISTISPLSKKFYVKEYVCLVSRRSLENCDHHNETNRQQFSLIIYILSHQSSPLFRQSEDLFTRLTAGLLEAEVTGATAFFRSSGRGVLGEGIGAGGRIFRLGRPGPLLGSLLGSSTFSLLFSFLGAEGFLIISLSNTFPDRDFGGFSIGFPVEDWGFSDLCCPYKNIYKMLLVVLVVIRI